MKILITGLWICAVTIASCYGAVTFGGGVFSGKKTEPYLEGLQYQKLAPINIPMIADGCRATSSPSWSSRPTPS
jgi:hypothetical protein